MSKTNNKLMPLKAGNYYHLYNRGNRQQNIFYKAKNYPYFLLKFAEYMIGYLDTFAYCLLPNHFHILIRVKEEKELLKEALEDLPLINEQTWLMWGLQVANFTFPAKQNLRLQEILDLKLEPDEISKITSWAVSERLRRWLMGYSKAINKQEGFTGSLFQKKIKRILITDMDYLRYLVWYLHNNPVHHNIFHSLQDYPNSSYKSLLSDNPTKLKRQEVLQWYGGKTELIKYHKEMTLGYDDNDIKFWTED